MPTRTKRGRIARNNLARTTVVAAGALSVAGALAGVAWKTLRPRGTAETPETIVSFTAASVTNAARKQVLEAVHGLEASVEILDAIGSASISVVRQAADAGADIVPAAVGAVQGARAAATSGPVEVEHAIAAASEGALAAATQLTAAAAERVSDALGAIEGIKSNRATAS
jgi:hypothetical protein